MIRTSNENNPIIPWCVWFAVCEDYYGQCRMPGDRFPFSMRGRLRRDCTCQASGATVRYICYDQLVQVPVKACFQCVRFSVITNDYVLLLRPICLCSSHGQDSCVPALISQFSSGRSFLCLPVTADLHVLVVTRFSVLPMYSIFRISLMFGLYIFLLVCVSVFAQVSYVSDICCFHYIQAFMVLLYVQELCIHVPQWLVVDTSMFLF